MNHQDWTQVVLRKPLAQQKNAEHVCVSKDKNKDERIRLSKIESVDDEINGHKLMRLSPEMRKMLIDARLARKLSQSDLAKQANLRPNIINDLENGKIITEKDVLQKIRKVLNVQLRF